MLKDGYLWVMGRSERLLARLAEGRWWLVRGVALALALSLFISFPRISFFLDNDTQIVSSWPVIESQAETPLSMSGEQYRTPNLHVAKRAFRLTVPLLMKVLHVDWRAMLALQFCLGVVLLFLAGKIAMDLFGDRIAALATVFGVSALYAGKAAFLQLGGPCDGFAFAFLTIAAATRNPLAIAAAILAACFTDERGMIAAPLVAIYWAIRAAGADGPRWLNVQTAAVVAAVGGAGLIRLFLATAYHLYVPTGPDSTIGIYVLGTTLPTFQNEFPHALAGLWLWPLAAAVLLVRARWWVTLVLLAGNAAAVTAVAFLVLDSDRSMAYTLPALYAAMAVAASRRMALPDVREIAIVGLIVSLLFPVNNLLGLSHNRYSVGNLMPVEIARFYYLSTHR